MPPTRIPVPPLQVTAHLANERKDQYPRTGWGHPSWHPSVCTPNFTTLHSLLSLGTSTPLLCLSVLQRLQTCRSVLTDTTGNSGRVQSQSLHRLPLSAHPFFQLLPQNQALQDPLQGAALLSPYFCLSLTSCLYYS